MIVIGCAAVAVPLAAFWLPVAWKSRDRSIDELAGRVRNAGIFVQSTLVVYERLAATGPAGDRAVDALAPATRDGSRT